METAKATSFCHEHSTAAVAKPAPAKLRRLKPILHIHNARIWTGDPVRPWANSLTAAAGRVVALDAPPPASADRVDARQFVVAPGLIDAHLHLLMGGQSLLELDLSSAKSRDDFERMVAREHMKQPPDRWLIARGWSSENWGGDLPDKSWLAAAGDRPAVCWRMDHHAVLVNDAVLRRCELPDRIESGRIIRDENGEASGLLIEATAWKLVSPIIPKATVALRQAALLAAQRHAHRVGLTAVGSMEYSRDVTEVYEPLRDRLTLRCMITLLDRPMSNESIDCSFAREFSHDDWLAIIGFKTFLDGTLGSRTARLLEDYDDDPGNRGMLLEVAAAGRLQEWIETVARERFSPSMHAIGDEAARMALDAILALDSATRNRARPRIEHAQQIDVADIARFRDVIASMQPLHKADDCRYVQRRLGEVRLAGTFAFRSLQEAGAQLAFGSDWPIVSCDPMLGIRAAVTGLTLDSVEFHPEQNLTVEEALRAYTREAAMALGMKDAGRLMSGALADLVMFDRDPFAADWRAAPPQVMMTIVNGEVVHDGREATATIDA